MTSITDFFKGDKDAAALMVMVHEIAHTWDDLVDQDKPVDSKAIHRAFWIALVGLRTNPFFQRFENVLLPVMEAGILNYVASCELERTPGHARQLAHTARYAIGDVALLIMRLIGGLDWAMEQAPALKLLLQTDKFEDFDKEMELRYGQI
jgi:hypothetical protein